jgi:ankyrin repeat protein
MMRNRILVFASTLLLSIALVGVLHFTARPISRTLEPHLPRMLDIAAERGEIRRMQFLIFLGTDVNGKVYSQFVCGNASEEDIAMDYHFPLQSAAYAGQGEAVELLLKKGANINATDGFGRTALWYVALGGHPDVARLLLERGADPRISIKQLPTSKSPLEEAAQEGETEIAGMFLDRGAGQNGELDSALWEAVWYDKPQTAKFLISKGANVNQIRYGMTLLERAYEHGDAEFIEYLKEAKGK